jgi:hypothetical protein
MTDQQSQFHGIIVGQLLDGGLLELLVAERPAQAQCAIKYPPVEAQPIAQGRHRALLFTGAFAGRAEQRALFLIEAGVELPQVVEGNARHRQRLQG